LLVAAEAELPEDHGERVVLEETTDERLALPEDDLDGLGGLDDADHARKDAEDAGLGAARREVRGRRLRVEAAIAGALARPEGGDLTVEAEDRAVDDGDALPHARVVDEVARGEVVEAVDDHVPALVEDAVDVGAVEPLLER